MDLCCVGLNHRTAPVDVRERHAVARDDLSQLVETLMGEPAISQAFVISTCNRVEAYVVPGEGREPSEVLGCVHRHVFTARGMDRAGLEKHTYSHVGRTALEHLFRVASSVDSMVLGEPQILGQLKEAWNVAMDAGAGGGSLQRVVERAFHVAKQVRTQTGIATGAVSISFVAVQLARRVFANLPECAVLVLGAGEMAELTAVHLAEEGARKVVIANRNLHRAEAIAQQHEGWLGAPLAELQSLLVESDIVVSSTGSRDAILSVDMVRKVLALRQYRPLFLVDIAVPRDIERGVAQLDGVYLYNVDDLEELANQNRESRVREVERAESMIQEAIERHGHWQAAQIVTPTISALSSRLMGIRDAEMQRSRKMMESLSPDQREAVERMASAMITRILHSPIARLKAATASEDASIANLTRAIRELFELADISLVDGGADDESGGDESAQSG